MSSDSFDEFLTLTLFLWCVWSAGWLARRSRVVPAMVAEIAVGLAFGPHGLDLLLEEDHHGLQVAGEMGIALLMVESGMHIDVRTMKKVGAPAFAVALLGAGVPFAVGSMIIGSLQPDSSASEQIVGACVLVPTSIGIALGILVEEKKLDTSLGKLIVAAAFMDDIFAIVVLSMVLQWSEGDLTAWGASSIVLFSLAFFAAGLAVSVKWLPGLLERLKALCPNDGLAHFEAHDRIVLFAMHAVLVLSAYVTSLFGSFLMGAFTTGVVFSHVPETHKVWRHQIKRILKWLVRMFFAASIGFEIPVSHMLEPEAFWQGMVLGVVAAIGGKVIPTLPLGRKGALLGIAMAGRGEFAFLMAEQFVHEHLISDQTYAMLLWALLLSVVFAPSAFRSALQRLSPPSVGGTVKGGPCSKHALYAITVQGPTHHSMPEDVETALEELELQVRKAAFELVEGSAGQQEALSVHAVAKEGKPPPTLRMLFHAVEEAIGDTHERITIRMLDSHNCTDLGAGHNLEEIEAEASHRGLKKIFRAVERDALCVAELHVDAQANLATARYRTHMIDLALATGQVELGRAMVCGGQGHLRRPSSFSDLEGLDDSGKLDDPPPQPVRSVSTPVTGDIELPRKRAASLDESGIVVHEGAPAAEVDAGDVGLTIDG